MSSPRLTKRDCLSIPFLVVRTEDSEVLFNSVSRRSEQRMIGRQHTALHAPPTQGAQK